MFTFLLQLIFGWLFVWLEWIRKTITVLWGKTHKAHRLIKFEIHTKWKQQLTATGFLFLYSLFFILITISTRPISLNGTMHASFLFFLVLLSNKEGRISLLKTDHVSPSINWNDQRTLYANFYEPDQKYIEFVWCVSMCVLGIFRCYCFISWMKYDHEMHAPARRGTWTHILIEICIHTSYSYSKVRNQFFL